MRGRIARAAVDDEIVAVRFATSVNGAGEARAQPLAQPLTWRTIARAGGSSSATARVGMGVVSACAQAGAPGQVTTPRRGSSRATMKPSARKSFCERRRRSSRPTATIVRHGVRRRPLAPSDWAALVSRRSRPLASGLTAARRLDRRGRRGGGRRPSRAAMRRGGAWTVSATRPAAAKTAAAPSRRTRARMRRGASGPGLARVRKARARRAAASGRSC